MIGATPTSGMVLVSAAIGSRPRCRNGAAVDGDADRRNPAPQPSAQPISTDWRTVCTKSAPSVPAAVEQRLPRSAQGAGSSTRGTSKPTRQQLPEHAAPRAPNSSGVPKRPSAAAASRRRQPAQAEHGQQRRAAPAPRRASAQRDGAAAAEPPAAAAQRDQRQRQRQQQPSAAGVTCAPRRRASRSATATAPVSSQAEQRPTSPAPTRSAPCGRSTSRSAAARRARPARRSAARDDRADQAGGDADPQRREQERQRRRHAQLPEGLRAASPRRCAAARARITPGERSPLHHAPP